MGEWSGSEAVMTPELSLDPLAQWLATSLRLVTSVSLSLSSLALFPLPLNVWVQTLCETPSRGNVCCCQHSTPSMRIWAGELIQNKASITCKCRWFLQCRIQKYRILCPTAWRAESLPTLHSLSKIIYPLWFQWEEIMHKTAAGNPCICLWIQGLCCSLENGSSSCGPVKVHLKAVLMIT